MSQESGPPDNEQGAAERLRQFERERGRDQDRTDEEAEENPESGKEPGDAQP